MKSDSSLNCPLCNGDTALLLEVNSKEYNQCFACRSVLLYPSYYLTSQEEKERYENHNNDVEDPRYQKFVSPIVQEVKSAYGPEHTGLDYGCGTGPVISKLLKDDGYQIALYDPFFAPDPQRLAAKYDYIVCCEVMEHFNKPADEFKRLRSLLNPGGVLFCMTEIYSEDIDFKAWYYKNDPTHVFFYHRKGLEWIKNNLGFSEVFTDGRLIILRL